MLERLANSIRALAPDGLSTTVFQDHLVIESGDRSQPALGVFACEFLTDAVFIAWRGSDSRYPWLDFERFPADANEIVRLARAPREYIYWRTYCPRCHTNNTLLTGVFCKSCGFDVRTIQGMPRLKQVLAWLTAGQLDRGREYKESEIDRLVRSALRPEILADPTMSADHLRVAMVEAGYVSRDPLGSSYRVAESYAGPADLEKRERELQLLGSRLAWETRMVRCPICGKELIANQLAGHCQAKHCAGEWCLKLYEAYGR